MTIVRISDDHDGESKSDEKGKKEFNHHEADNAARSYWMKQLTQIGASKSKSYKIRAKQRIY